MDVSMHAENRNPPQGGACRPAFFVVDKKELLMYNKGKGGKGSIENC